MKKTVFTIALLWSLQFSLTAGAQQEKVTLRVPQFARPLVERWTAEYRKTHADVDFLFVNGQVENPSNSLTVNTDDEAVLFARYAVLPVTTSQSEAERLIGSHALNNKKLKSLFFVKEDELDDETESKGKEPGVALHIYTGNSQQSASRLYAAHLKEETVNYKGKKISGDDAFLNMAISRDPLGVTVNSLPNIYDLKSRRLKQGLALLPLDIDKQGRQLLKEGTLDDILQQLEQAQYAEIPVGSLGFEYNHANTVLSDFVQWVLNFGTADVHDYGLLQLPQKELTVQLRRMVQKDLAQK